MWKRQLPSARSRYVLPLLAAVLMTAASTGRAGVATAPLARDAAPGYPVHRPAGLSQSQQVPLVVALGGSVTERASGFDSFADRYGCVVAYPDTNALPPQPTEQATRAAQIQFLSDVIDQLTASENIDPSRVYVTGASGGGIGSYRIACELSTKVAAIGSVSGALLAKDVAGCKPSRPVSVIEIHGTTDTAVPYNGDQFYLSSAASTGFWRTFDGCPSTAVTATQGPVTTQTWSPCAGGTAVTLMVITGGGHSWPRTAQIDATAQLWAFFAAHPAPTATTAAIATLQKAVVAGRRPHLAVSVRLALRGPATVRAALRTGTTTVTAHVFHVASGVQAIRLPVPDRAGPGRRVLVLTVTAPGGASQRITTSVRLPGR